MEPSSSLLTIPITLLPEKDASSNELLTHGCSKARVQVLKSWGLGSPGSNAEPGALIGTQDGSIYLFGPVASPPLPPSASSRTFEVPSSRATSPLSQRDSRTPSRSSTPSLTSPLPFNVAQRARIVSGITADSVEAPKNYVDFDDEPEKLKDMLKGRGAKESLEKRGSIDEGSLKTIGSKNSSSRSLSSPPTTSRKNSFKIPAPVKPFPTKAQVPALSLTLASPSPTFSRRSVQLHPWSHVILPSRGTRLGVRKVLIDESKRLAFVLQENGGISILSLQDGTCLAHIDANANRLESPSGVQEKNVDHDVWLWDHLALSNIGETPVLIVTAVTDSNYLSPETSNLEDSSTLDASRICIFELNISDQVSGAPDVSLNKVGEWLFDGVPSSAGVHRESDGTIMLHCLSHDGNLILRDIELLPKGIFDLPDSSLEEDSPPHHSIPLPNPFKNHKAKSLDLSELDHRQPGRIRLGKEQNLGIVLSGDDLRWRSNSTDGSLLGAVWSSDELLILDYRLGSIRTLFRKPVQNLQDLQFSNYYSYSLLYEDRIEQYAIEARTGAEPQKGDVIHPKLLKTLTVGPNSAADIEHTNHSLTARVDVDDEEPLCLKYHASSGTRTLWDGAVRQTELPENMPEVTSLLPLDLETIIIGSADGYLRRTSFLSTITNPEEISKARTSQPSLNASIVALSTVRNMRTKEQFIVGGGDDGSVAFWSLDHLKLVARWTIFISPLRYVVPVEDKTETPLKGCALCVSVNGTIAVIAIDGFQFLYVVPGAAAPVAEICIGGTNLMLIYTDRRARLWDVQTKEFWRSMKLDKAEEMLGQGGWIKLPLSELRPSTTILRSNPFLTSNDGASTLFMNIEQFASESASQARTISTNRDQTRAILRTLERLKALLSVLLTPGLSNDIDTVCHNGLSLQRSNAVAGNYTLGSFVIYKTLDPRNPWILSPEATASRLLALATILQTLSIFEEFIEAANTVLILYSTSLGSVIGSAFQRPCLVSLARFWFSGSVEIRKAARTVFDYTVASLSDDESNALAEHWQHKLPCLQPTVERESMQAALALYMCGYLAAARYSLLPTSTLVDISKSIALYLHDEQSLHRVLAVDLCSRGFHVWQHYIDAMEILRQLFTLATATRKDSISLQNVASQARLAVLQIAASDTALFMHTLGLDILNPPSLEHRKSVLQVVAFLVRKKPLVLQPNVPKLLEAVVKSLDPSVTTHRDAVFDSATEIIGYVVNTFPSVDFNTTVQRLAVGTDEGAVVMYDVKTAIRLYVLEGHKHAVTACSFSPDGRRLLSLSLEENAVLVWKVGTSFTSFFTPGVPPRQGHGGSEPFKRFNFYPTAEGLNMTLAEARDSVHFEWAGDRSVKLKIREIVMSFST